MTAWYQNPAKAINHHAAANAQTHQDNLTKPKGSLGELERVAVRLAGLQGVDKPSASRPHIAIFAGDHGVMAEQVSAFPQVVTQQMLANFATGGACIAVMAKHLGASLEVVDCGAAATEYDTTGISQQQVAKGTKNFTQAPAMTLDECEQALAIGKRSVEQAMAAGADIYVAGEMGIGNTCAASALACLLLDKSAEEMTGRGTGVDDTTLARKIQAVSRAKILYQHEAKDALKTLANVGGFEMCAMTGAYVRAAQLGLLCVVDGFISSVSALVAVRLNPSVADWLLYGHRSAEYAHAQVLAALGAKPLLDLGFRLGEGSGAAASLMLIRLACEIHANMATFAQAGVATA
ncbi:nicotinate-nucleotide--dimethylbenzimidazole phosphoribosyltransferase [Moraxella caviae]|uniref:Nicotinate-nucleotide--dimethylbenzimidazole phosphoribosyltransferase n=1 Tax=Moraxella caviae TaxID=34060 RepID=A0A1T0ADN6_9GAMM|nr:nicotinate-nucleotide--dimethylbenzimidazole phosphoribosyltransferase [Moraxella caviae]OOR93421.1 nicotinate-nucleotide--dimethylbenzimidazole phosphoribosyltransferase [Moraxella caviae]STZ14078.1 Nicotinate-nucleotide--dimethylbenzimidazole phosphoribosyltransferase [Moraxella caviae]VEW11149.1 Nicotinate-nucleotide--dimethylbenzimidazole phosphoribosyltransferase [Moraxella caviae]